MKTLISAMKTQWKVGTVKYGRLLFYDIVLKWLD